MAGSVGSGGAAVTPTLNTNGMRRTIRPSENAPRAQANYTLEINRLAETSKSTISAFTLRGPDSKITGFIWEPNGPGSTVLGSGVRIPGGNYQMEWTRTTQVSAWMGPATYKVTTPSVNARGIRMHRGTTHDDT